MRCEHEAIGQMGRATSAHHSRRSIWRAQFAHRREARGVLLQAWVGLEANVPGLQLVSVYARGSIVRGLGLPGISDIDTLGYAVVDTTAAASEIRAWRRERSEELRGRHAAVASGFDLELVAAPRDSAIGRWLLGEAEATALRAPDMQDRRTSPRVLRARLWYAAAAEAKKHGLCSHTLTNTHALDTPTLA